MEWLPVPTTLLQPGASPLIEFSHAFLTRLADLHQAHEQKEAKGQGLPATFPGQPSTKRGMEGSFSINGAL